MNLLQSRLKFRQRTPWEAVDLGRRLITSELTYYMALYAALMLPFVLLGIVLFWNSPGWMLAWLWWLKPVYEYGILSALSIHVFQPLPPLKMAIKTGFQLMWRRQTFGDITWRRVRLCRSFELPIQQLEQLQGNDYRLRRRELSRYGSSTASGLTLIGNALESIWVYAVMVLVYWFLYGNFIQQGLVQPSHMDEIGNLVSAMFDSWANDELSDFFNYSAWAYYLTLIFWGPFYVAGGFTLYLNARTKSEAWDIRLIWQQLGERLRQGSVWSVCLAVVVLAGLFTAQPSVAETLPSEQTVEHSRDTVLKQAPFYHTKTENRWCWLSCEPKTKKNPSSPTMVDAPNLAAGSAFIKPLGYLVLIALVISVLYFIFHWLGQRGMNPQQTGDNEAPTMLFGLDVRAEALPKDVSKQAAALLQTDPRAALSLLYRASLSQLINQQQLPIKQHHTEGAISQLVHTQLPMLSPFFNALTSAWLRTAYGHRQLPIEELQPLCQQYAQHFENRGGA